MTKNDNNKVYLRKTKPYYINDLNQAVEIDSRKGIDTYKKDTAVSTGYNKVKGSKPAGQAGTKLDGNILVAFLNNGKLGSIRLVNKDTHIKDAMISLKRDLKEMVTELVS